MGSEQVREEARELPASEEATCEAGGSEARGKVGLVDASELLCNAYEIALGASEALKMLYVRLQEAYDPESTLIASVLFQIGYSLDSARDMIAEADEAVSASSRAVNKEQRHEGLQRDKGHAHLETDTKARWHKCATQHHDATGRYKTVTTGHSRPCWATK